MTEKYKCRGEECPAYQLNNEHVRFCRVANKTPVDLGDVCLNPDFAYPALSSAKSKDGVSQGVPSLEFARTTRLILEQNL